jgi:non-lysosomal glucosylceramidase
MNTFVGGLYLAALRAAEEMAKATGDAEFASKCRALFESGSKLSDERLFDGEYYVQQVDLKEHPQHQYERGCLSDQLFGQNWAAQLSLGDIYKKDNIRAALASVYRYNWTPDLTRYSKEHPPGRWFAREGEAGLITCTFPKSDYLKEGILYREEVWTGIEYQVASHMIHEGMLNEAFAILRGVHERYDAKKHNPWNEIECGDHYARAMASWACLTASCGFEYNGPRGVIGFSPRITNQDFRAPFTTAAGWGTFSQTKELARIELKWGELRLTQVKTSKPVSRVELNDRAMQVALDAQHGTRCVFDALTLKNGDRLTIHF